MRFSILVISIVLILASCKSETKKESKSAPKAITNSLQIFDNPSKSNSSLPRLFSSNNKLYLSWVEKKDTLAILNFSVFENEKWSPVEAIVSGSDWFTNWADFPAIAGCPVNGPSIDSYGNNVAIAWFTAAEDSPKVQVAFSQNIGKTFGLPFRIDNGNTLGRVDIVMISDTAAVVSWMENIGDDTLIQVVKVENNGLIGSPVTISKTSAERASGFPQLEVLGTKIYLAWTDVKGEISSIKTATLGLESF